MSGERKINERQRRFAELYISSGNAYQSALEAGYSESYSRINSHDLLEKPSVMEYLAELRSQTLSVTIATARERQEFLTAVLRGEIEETVIVDGDTISKPPALRDRLAAAKILAMMQGDFEKDDERTPPTVIINMPTGPMGEMELEEARRAQRSTSD